jgi:XTP/dITP diphosphohydrolase
MNQDQANVALLLEELKRRPNAPRTARFVCELALALEGLLIHARGVLEGTIGEEPKGGGGFGYDCLFIPEGATKTLAELSANEKNSISHRARAVHELMAQIRNLGIT